MRPTLTRFAAPAIVCVLGVGLMGCESKVTDENFAKISAGMTQNAVEKMLGKGIDETGSGISISGAGVVGSDNRSKLTVIRYKDGGKSIVVTYKDDKVQDWSKQGF
ncbi:MAG: hypothetical protein ACT4PL_08750 [Phycisphaerales bacterium]